jgi:hypothetical protein
MACLRLVTFRPDRPLRNLPALRSRTARSTLRPAAFEYFRAFFAIPLKPLFSHVLNEHFAPLAQTLRRSARQ